MPDRGLGFTSRARDSFPSKIHVSSTSLKETCLRFVTKGLTQAQMVALREKFDVDGDQTMTLVPPAFRGNEVWFTNDFG